MKAHNVRWDHRSVFACGSPSRRRTRPTSSLARGSRDTGGCRLRYRRFYTRLDSPGHRVPYLRSKTPPPRATPCAAGLFHAGSPLGTPILTGVRFENKKRAAGRASPFFLSLFSIVARSTFYSAARLPTRIRRGTRKSNARHRSDSFRNLRCLGKFLSDFVHGNFPRASREVSVFQAERSLEKYSIQLVQSV